MFGAINYLTGAVQESLDITDRLAGTVDIFDQADADMAIAVFPEADTRGDGDLGFAKQQF